jgi:heat shock protein HslJ
MKATVGFIFFMLFLAGLAFVNVRSMKDTADAAIISADQLTDVGWRPTNLGDMVVDEETRMFVQFNADGEMAGHAGCNRIFGSYQVSEGQLVFGPIGATRMACDPVTDSLEISFLEALGNTTNAARVDDRLAFRDDTGQNLLRFTAVDRVEN